MAPTPADPTPTSTATPSPTKSPSDDSGGMSGGGVAVLVIFLLLLFAGAGWIVYPPYPLPPSSPRFPPSANLMADLHSTPRPPPRPSSANLAHLHPLPAKQLPHRARPSLIRTLAQRLRRENHRRLRQQQLRLLRHQRAFPAYPRDGRGMGSQDRRGG